MQSGIYMKTDSQGEVRYLQVKDVNSENKLDYTQIATVINTGINDKHWLKNGDLLFAAKGGSNYCIQYEGTERSTIASSSFIIIRPVISNIIPALIGRNRSTQNLPCFTYDIIWLFMNWSR